MAISAGRIKNQRLKLHPLQAISEAKRSCRSESEFRAELRQQGIDVLFRRNDEGRIYGATFIDHTTRTVLNGSRLGKEYSANIFNDLYGRKQEKMQVVGFDTHLVGVSQKAQQSEGYNEGSHISDNITGGLFAVLTPEPEHHPKEEMPFPYRKKKKKRRYGRQV